MHIDHINISSSKVIIDRVKAFYCHVLNLNDGYRPNFSSSGYWLYSNNNPVIHLIVGEEGEGTENTGRLDHVAFQVSDLAPVIARLETIGVEYETVYVQDISMKQIFFKDPAGLKIEVNCFENDPAQP